MSFIFSYLLLTFHFHFFTFFFIPDTGWHTYHHFMNLKKALKSYPQLTKCLIRSEATSWSRNEAMNQFNLPTIALISSSLIFGIWCGYWFPCFDPTTDLMRWLHGCHDKEKKRSYALHQYHSLTNSKPLCNPTRR